jgi:hypothetical protein
MHRRSGDNPPPTPPFSVKKNGLFGGKNGDGDLLSRVSSANCARLFLSLADVNPLLTLK